MATETRFDMHSMEHLARNALDGIFLIDHERHYVFVSESLESMTGYKSTELVDKDCMCADVLDCRDEQGRKLSSVLCPTNALFDGTQNSARQRLQIRRRDGSNLWIETIYTVVPGTSGPPEHILGIVRDITEVKARETELLNEIAALRERARQLGGTPGMTGQIEERFPRPTASSATVDDSLRLDPLLARFEREAILRALQAAHGQRNRAAQMMGISRSRLYRRMEALGVDLKDHP